MEQRNAAMLAGAAAVGLAATMLGGPASADRGESHHGGRAGLPAVGLTTDQKLVSFGVDRPERTSRIGRVTGLVGDTRLVGIDFRVNGGRLYGVGDAGGVYVVSTRDGSATKVSQLSVALTGSTFGVDFNPAADRLRITSDTGQNLRHNVDVAIGATIVDGTLTYPLATTPATGINGSAYTNNDNDPDTATTLFDIDTMMDQVALQSPANSGQLAGTGRLGVDAGSDSGFDIYSDLDDGKAQRVEGFATLSVGGRYRLYRVSLLSGDADHEGRFPRGTQVSDIAVRLEHGRG